MTFLKHFEYFEYQKVHITEAKLLLMLPFFETQYRNFATLTILHKFGL